MWVKINGFRKFLSDVKFINVNICLKINIKRILLNK